MIPFDAVMQIRYEQASPALEKNINGGLPIESDSFPIKLTVNTVSKESIPIMPVYEILDNNIENNELKAMLPIIFP